MSSTESTSTVPSKTVFSDPIHFLAFGFGAGLAPKAPGTFGTLVALPFVLALSQFSFITYLFITLLTCVVGIWICEKSAKALGVHDHPGIVWDEIAGLLITMTGVTLSWQNLLLGFVLFRLFDIVKPWPIKIIDQKVDGGLGIMLDDVIAGIFAWAILFTLNFLELPFLGI